MSRLRVAYNERQEPLEVLLRTIDRPGEYWMQDRLLAPMPRVEVEGARSLSFPITEEQAHSLVAVAEPAPYGRGEQTLVDSSVRACRQIDAAHERITGGVWRDTLAQVVAQAAAGLGCPPEHTSAHLYKLLVYEPGGFFAPHRDTEKVDGMVATLVVSLPVAGAGGELMIRHRERQTVVDLRTDEPSEIAFAAFYADCVHEIRPVTAGHRVVLVYHLVVRGAAAAVLRAPDYGAQEERISAQLRSWEATSAAGDKLVWLLEHQYSEAGLSFDVLKNADAALGRVLARAAQRTNHVLYATILSIYEMGTVDEPGDFPIWDEPEDYDWDDEDWDEEQIDSTRELYGLVAPGGSRPDYGALPLLAGELLPAGTLDGVEPDHEDTRVTGNEGVQLSRSYRRAALVLWPRGRTLGTLARGGIERAVAWFADDLARSEDDPGAQSRLSGLAAQLIDTWPAPDPARFYRRHHEDGIQQGCRDVLRLLRRLEDEATTRRFLSEVVTRHYSSGENDERRLVRENDRKNLMRRAHMNTSTVRDSDDVTVADRAPEGRGRIAPFEFVDRRSFNPVAQQRGTLAARPILVVIAAIALQPLYHTTPETLRCLAWANTLRTAALQDRRVDRVHFGQNLDDPKHLERIGVRRVKWPHKLD